MVRSQCPVCSLQFLTEQSRNDHIIRVHLQNEDEYRCTTCSGLFKSEINLRKHFERYHPNTEAMEITKPDSDDDSIENMSKEIVEDEKQLYRRVVRYLHKNWRVEAAETSRCNREIQMLQQENQTLKRQLCVLQRKLKARDQDLCNTLQILHRFIREQKQKQRQQLID